MTEQVETIGLIDPDDPEPDGPEGPVDERRRTIVLRVYSPRHPDPKRFRFPLDQSVGDAAAQAAKEFGYDGGTPTFRRHNGDVLDRAVSLREAELRNREKVEIVDVGGGV